MVDCHNSAFLEYCTTSIFDSFKKLYFRTDYFTFHLSSFSGFNGGIGSQWVAISVTSSRHGDKWIFTSSNLSFEYRSLLLRVVINLPPFVYQQTNASSPIHTNTRCIAAGSRSLTFTHCEGRAVICWSVILIKDSRELKASNFLNSVP